MTLVMLLKPEDPTVLITNLDVENLDGLRGIVGCQWLEPLYLPDRVVMLFDEEAGLKHLRPPMNQLATAFAAHYERGILPGILGVVAVLGQANSEGKFTDVPASAVNAVVEIVGGLELEGG